MPLRYARNARNNYRPASILPTYIKNLWEIFINYPILLINFSQNTNVIFNTQFFCLLAMLEILKSAMDKRKSFSVLSIDLSKAFDCLSDELLLAKPRAYGFSIAALRVIHSYSKKNRWQKTKIGMSYSPWEEIVFGVPQGSIPRSLLFSIVSCDLFPILKETGI